MKIAIMQPYFFAYEGYFELISSVDLIVFLDDAQYVRRSWINRNQIYTNKKIDKKYLTVPIAKSPINSKIKDIKIAKKWTTDHINVLKNNYKKESNFYNFYESLDHHIFLCPMLVESIKWTCDFLKIKINYSFSSVFPSNEKSENRVIELCKKFNAKHYYNLPNGEKIYNKLKFMENNISLNFLNTDKFEKISIINRIL